MRFQLVIIIGFLSFDGIAQQPLPLDLLNKMIIRCGEVDLLEYTMEKRERVRGKISKQRSFIRLNRKPFKIYLRQEVPRDGLEALYVKGANKNRILINPNGFPWINLNLATHSGLVRRDQHHTIDHSGYDYFIKILSSNMAADSNIQHAQMKCSPIMNWLGQSCWKIDINNPLYTEQKTHISNDINLTSLADSLYLCEYKIVELNRGLKAGEIIRAKSQIVLPSHYAKEISIYISSTHFLPITFEIKDEQGVYERYDYLDLVVDPSVDHGVFTADYPSYKF